MRWAVLALLLCGCGQAPDAPGADGPGARLEAAAELAGIVADPRGPIEGSWARDTDRLCVAGARIGVAIDYGEGQQCAASGSVRRSGASLAIVFGGCKFTARYEGDRIAFPAVLPQACEALCSGRASLDAMIVDRLSGSRAEAETLRSPDGRLLCGS